jgi:hypothetical protein
MQTAHWGVNRQPRNPSVNRVQVAVDHIAMVTDAQFNALSSRTSIIEGRLDNLDFRLDDIDQSTRGGIAAAAALGSAIALPDKRLTLAGNIATYRGEQGFAATLTGRMSENFAIGAGVAGNSGDGAVVAQAGFAIGF